MSKYTILIFISFLLFSPFVSWAASFVPVSLPCSSAAMYDDSEVSSLPVFCPFCPSKGATKVKLKWEINDRSYTNQHCFLSCTDKEGKSCGQIYYRTKDGLPSIGPEGPNAIKLRANDSIYLTDYKDGQSYVASCCEKCLPTTPPENCPFPWICRLNTLESSAQAQIKKECRQPCEVPFQSIVDKLEANQFVTITENSFADWWDQLGGPDYVGWPKNNRNGGFGSGSKADVQEFVESIQLCQSIDLEGETTTGILDPSTVISPIIQASNSFTPIRISLIGYKFNPLLLGTTPEVTFHEVISLGTNLRNLTEFNNLGFGNASQTDTMFSIKIMDSNSLALGDPVVSELNCYKTTDSHHIIFRSREQSIIRCMTDVWYQYFILRRVDLGGPIIPCNPRVRPRPTEWLEENGQFIRNWGGDGDNHFLGVCWGLSNFFIKVACYGTFSGVDYHPGDDNYVGTDCDANHMPIDKQASFVGSDLVASMRFLIDKLFPL